MSFDSFFDIWPITYFFNLDEVGEAGKDDATDKDEEDQEKKFFVAVLKLKLTMFSTII